MEFLLAGLVLGSIYAIVAAGLVVTYTSTGVLNFAFGAEGYCVARMYYFLNTQHGLSIATSAAICILVVSPCLGLVLYFAVFRFLRLSSTLTKIVATIGLSVSLPAIASLLFGDAAIGAVPGLAPQPVKVVHLLGLAITLDQLIVIACLIAVSGVGMCVLRFTDVGIAIRAMVDSPALTSVLGTSPGALSMGVWISTTFSLG